MTTREAIAAILPKQQAAHLNQLLKEAKTPDAMAELGAVLDCVLVQAKNYLATPALYATDGKEPEERVVYLHYFVGGSDWFILERGLDDDRSTVYGLVRMFCTEYGYIDLPSLIDPEGADYLHRPELDFH